MNKVIRDERGNVTHKECGVCHDMSPIENFHWQNKAKGSRVSRCKPCACSAVVRYSKTERGRAAKKRYRQSVAGRVSARRYRQSVAGRATQEKYGKSEWGRRAHCESSRRQRTLYPERYRARQLLHIAIRGGKIVLTKVCAVCDTVTGVECHHDDYAKPLEFRELCNEHHKIADAERCAREEFELVLQAW